MKVILSGGGTGGHIYPAIAIADALKRLDPAVKILFVGASGKMEMQSVPASGYEIVGLNIRGFQRKQWHQNFSLPFRLISSLWKAHRIIKDFQPDVVVGTGGYASAPVLYTAARKKIPTLIQEPNAVPGLTSQVLSRYVDRICVAYAQVKRNLPPEKITLTGTPVRQDFLQKAKKRQTACAHFGLVPEKKCLLVLGGSLGAKTINESILNTVDRLVESAIQVIWATGKPYFERIQAQLKPQQKTLIKVYPLITSFDLAHAYAAADVVISRAGIGTIAELCIAQKPVIFVPSPNVTADHPTQNVLPLAESQAALMIKDEDACQELIQTAMNLLDSEEQQKILISNIKEWAKPEATTAITQAIVELVAHKKSLTPAR